MYNSSGTNRRKKCQFLLKIAKMSLAEVGLDFVVLMKTITTETVGIILRLKIAILITETTHQTEYIFGSLIKTTLLSKDNHSVS